MVCQAPKGKKKALCEHALTKDEIIPRYHLCSILPFLTPCAKIRQASANPDDSHFKTAPKQPSADPFSKVSQPMNLILCKVVFCLLLFFIAVYFFACLFSITKCASDVNDFLFLRQGKRIKSKTLRRELPMIDMRDSGICLFLEVSCAHPLKNAAFAYFFSGCCANEEILQDVLLFFIEIWQTITEFGIRLDRSRNKQQKDLKNLRFFMD